MAQRHSSRGGDRHEKGTKGTADDAFVARVFEASTWAEKNTQTLILLGIVLLVLGGGVFYWLSYRSNLTETAGVQLEQIRQMTQMGDPETARAELDQFIETFGGTPYAAEARLALAELHLQADRPEEAVAVLSESDVSLREPIGVQLAVLHGKALEAAGRLEEAEEAYLEVAERAELEFQRIEALADAARVRESTGDLDGAVALYERLLDEMEPGDGDYGLYQMRLAEARARADSGD